jgi:hypothetical protein
MLSSRILGAFAAVALVGLLPASPASAGRTVIDSGLNIPLSGYCSPNTANTSDCFTYPLPSGGIQIGGTTYNSFYVNSNGTVSFQSIESFLAPENSATPPPPLTSLGDYGSIPIFSPNFVDGQGFIPINPSDGFDGAFVADTSTSSSGFTVSWFSCDDPLHCGQVTVDLLTAAVFDPTQVGDFGLVDTLINNPSTFDPTASDQANFDAGRLALLGLADAFPIYTMTLTDLASGFQVDYTYNAGALGQTGTYGFNLPTAQFATTGPLTNQTFLFDSNGQLVTSIASVPEPSTWMTMLLGFALAGFGLRRKRRLQAIA